MNAIKVILIRLTDALKVQGRKRIWWKSVGYCSLRLVVIRMHSDAKYSTADPICVHFRPDVPFPLHIS